MLNISIENLTKSYGEKEVLHNLSLFIEQPGVYLIAGPNGSGKTTLLEILVGLRGKDSGSVSIGGMDPRTVKVKKHIGFLAQQNSLRRNSLVMEEVQLVKDIFQLDIDILTYLNKFNLSEYSMKKTRKLSGGTKRRLLIAMTLMPQHNIVILDEPASGLDTGTRDEIWNCIKDYGRHNIALVSDHYLNEAAQYSDYVYLINKGNIVLEGKTNQLLEEFEMKHVIKTRSQQVDNVKTKILQYSDDYEIRVSGTVCNIFFKSDQERIDRMMRDNEIRLNMHSVNLEDIYFYFTGDIVRDEVLSYA